MDVCFFLIDGPLEGDAGNPPRREFQKSHMLHVGIYLYLPED